jgi:hypothetical protein
MLALSCLTGPKAFGATRPGNRKTAYAALVLGGATAVWLVIQAAYQFAQLQNWLRGSTGVQVKVGFGAYFGVLCALAVCGFGLWVPRSAATAAQTNHASAAKQPQI